MRLLQYINVKQGKGRTFPQKILADYQIIREFIVVN